MADILVDTSALYALADRGDEHHAESRAILEALPEGDAVAAALGMRLGIKRVFTFDRHFRQMGFELLKPQFK